MFATPEYVVSITDAEANLVTIQRVFMAQEIIEAVVGRTEAEIDNANDLALLAKATAYQTVYMLKNYDTVFQQMGLRSTSQGDSSLIFDVDLLAPYLAPLAVIALRNLSFRASRSVKTGRMGPKAMPTPWERD